MKHAACVLMLALFATASTEYGREMLRKPFVIGRYMYSNGVRTMNIEHYNTNGYLAGSLWTAKLPEDATPQQKKLAMGEAMFRGQCASCHTRDVYRSMKRLIGERDRNAINSVLKVLKDHDKTSPYIKYMPQLVGTSEEIDALSEYLVELSKKPEAPKTTAKN